MTRVGAAESVTTMEIIRGGVKSWRKIVADVTITRDAEGNTVVEPVKDADGNDVYVETEISEAEYLALQDDPWQDGATGG